MRRARRGGASALRGDVLDVALAAVQLATRSASTSTSRTGGRPRRRPARAARRRSRRRRSRRRRPGGARSRALGLGLGAHRRGKCREQGRRALARTHGRRRRAAARRRARARARRPLASALGVVVDEHVRARRDRVDPLGRRPQRHARDAVPVRLLLQPARVGEDHARLRGERGEVEVAERLTSRTCGAESRARPPASAARVRGCAGKTTGPSTRREALDDAAAAVSGRTFASRWIVATT